LAVGLSVLTFGVAAEAQDADDPVKETGGEDSTDAGTGPAGAEKVDDADAAADKAADKSVERKVREKKHNSRPTIGNKRHDAPPSLTRIQRLKRRYDRTVHQKPKRLDFFGLPIIPIFYGDVQMDIMHDFNALGLGTNFINEFITAEIPAPGTQPARLTNRTGFSINQTQIYAGFWVPTDLGKALVFTNINFEQQIYGPPLFELYLAYAEVGGLRAGKAWSTFSNVPAIPDTLDYEGPNAIPEVQNVMLGQT